MESEFLKRNLKLGKTITLDNERTFTDDFRSAECTFQENARNSWANGFKIEFNGATFLFKTFEAFKKKLDQLQKDFNLELKKW